MKNTKLTKKTPEILSSISDIDLKSFDRYSDLKLIGEGGVSRVYKAHDPKLDRDVAIKILRKGIASSDKAKKRFSQEITLQANLSIPGCVKIYDCGEKNGNIYCVMELVDGKSLDKLIADNILFLDDKIKILKQILEILSSIHKLGYEHRDIKPGNIIIDKNKKVFLLDFGLAKAIDSRLNIYSTVYGEFFGTPAYMSPEQSAVSEKNERKFASDVYSVGVLAYELFTGHLPYELENLSHEEVTYIINNEPPKPIKNYSLNIPSGVESIVLKSLNKNPFLRPSSKEFLNEVIKATGSSNSKSIIRKTTSVLKKSAIPSGASRKQLLKGITVRFSVVIVVLIAIIFVYMFKAGGGGSTAGSVVTDKADSTSLLKAFKLKDFTLPGLDIKMIKISSGSFKIRTPKPKRVFITNDFYISAYEITISQYAKVLLGISKNLKHKNKRLPITFVSWHDAKNYCRLITAREKEAGRLPDGYEYRIPTEAEWEYAASAGSNELYYHGGMKERLPLYAVYETGKVLPGGTKKPNKFGLYDTLGNVWEWCYDVKKQEAIFSFINPVNNGKEYLERAIRGGSVNTVADKTTLSAKNYISPHSRYPDVGFRIVLGKKLDEK